MISHSGSMHQHSDSTRAYQYVCLSRCTVHMQTIERLCTLALTTFSRIQRLMSSVYRYHITSRYGPSTWEHAGNIWRREVEDTGGSLDKILHGRTQGHSTNGRLHFCNSKPLLGVFNAKEKRGSSSASNGLVSKANGGAALFAKHLVRSQQALLLLQVGRKQQTDKIPKYCPRTNDTMHCNWGRGCVNRKQCQCHPCLRNHC